MLAATVLTIAILCIAVWPALVTRYGSPRLFDMAAQGNIAGLLKALETAESVDVTDREGKTALMYAAMCRRDDAVDVLIKRGADIHRTADGGGTALHMAAAMDAAKVCRKLIESGAHVDWTDDHGVSALHYASGKGHITVARVLLQEGACSNLKDSSHRTPLDVASKTAMQVLLLRHGGKSGKDVRMVDVLAGLPANSPARGRVPVAWHVSMEHPRMAAAIERAQESLAVFLSRREEGDAAVKWAVNERGITEYVWSSVTREGDSDELITQLVTPPVNVKVSAGPVAVPLSRVVDWSIRLAAGPTVGAFTHRVWMEVVRDEFGFLPPDADAELAMYIDP